MTRLIDISLDVYEGMPVFPAPWYPKPEITPVITPDKDPAGRTARKMTILTHTATHIDAPEHFVKGGKHIDEIPPEVFVGDAVVADMFEKVPKGAVTAKDLEKAVGDKVRAGDALIIRTGWTTKNWGAPEYFTDSPYLTKDGAEWIVEKKVRMVGIDFQTDRPGDTAFPVHKTLLKNGVLILEYITNTERIRRDRVKLIALPLKLKGAEAAPARVFVEEE